MRYLYLLSFLFFSLTFESKAQDYIVTLANEVEYGQVTYAPGSQVKFKAEGAKKSDIYYPMQIRGYFHKGVYHASKFSAQFELNIFMPSFREGDDPEVFKKITKLDLKAIGKINFYHGFVQGMGTGMNSQVEVRELDIKGNPVYTQDISINSLAEAVKDYSELKARVLEMKGRLKVEQIEQVVKEYNAWHEFRYAANKE